MKAESLWLGEEVEVQVDVGQSDLWRHNLITKIHGIRCDQGGLDGSGSNRLLERLICIRPIGIGDLAQSGRDMNRPLNSLIGGENRRKEQRGQKRRRNEEEEEDREGRETKKARKMKVTDYLIEMKLNSAERIGRRRKADRKYKKTNKRRTKEERTKQLMTRGWITKRAVETLKSIMPDQMTEKRKKERIKEITKEMMRIQMDGWGKIYRKHWKMKHEEIEAEGIEVRKMKMGKNEVKKKRATKGGAVT